MQRWILSANPKYFDHKKAFEIYGYIDWKQTRKYEIGDIVYIYVTKPIAKIVYRTIVEKINMDQRDISDMSMFFTGNMQEDSREKKYMRLILNKEYDEDDLSFSMLQNNGMKYAPQSPCKVKIELENYIRNVEEKNEEKIN